MAMTRRRAGCAAILAFVAGSVCASAQESWTLAEFRVVGSKEYTTEEILQASGLIKGRSVTKDDLSAAARTLVSTGAFSHVSYSYGGRDATGIIVTFTIDDAPAYLPMRFENFVWAKDAELLSYLREKVPLFHGRVTRYAELLDRIDEALDQWLAAHGVHGTTKHRFHAAGETGPIDAVSFEVVDVPMTIRSIAWVDAPSLDRSDRTELETLLVGSAYERTAVHAAVEEFVGRVYRRRGRLKARAGAVEPRVTSSEGAPVDIALTITIIEGAAYTVGAVEWKTALEEQDRPRLHVRPGAIADDGAQLDADLETARREMVARGYMKATVRSAYRFHEAEKTVDYVIDVQPGALFHMGTVRFEGIPEVASARLTRKWKLKSGDLYDNAYPKVFLSENTDLLRGRTVNIRVTPVEANLVDVTFVFE